MSDILEGLDFSDTTPRYSKVCIMHAWCFVVDSCSVLCDIYMYTAPHELVNLCRHCCKDTSHVNTSENLCLDDLQADFMKACSH